MHATDPTIVFNKSPDVNGSGQNVLMTGSGDLTAVSGAMFWRTLGWTDDFGFLQTVPFVVVVAGSEGVGAAMHHPSIKAVGHGEGFQMAS